MTKQEALDHAKKYGWSSKLGFSKRDLGIKTSKNSQAGHMIRRTARKLSGGIQKRFFKILKQLIKNHEKRIGRKI